MRFSTSLSTTPTLSVLADEVGVERVESKDMVLAGGRKALETWHEPLPKTPEDIIY